MIPAIDLIRSEARRRMLDESLARIERCVRLLDEEQMWRPAGAATVPVANLVLHLEGNIRQWILCGLGGQTDRRDRDQEFMTRHRVPVDELLRRLRDTITEAVRVIEAADDSVFTATHPVQVFRESGIAIVVHVVEHLSYHTGQITLLTKLVTGRDLGFYAGVDLQGGDRRSS